MVELQLIVVEKWDFEDRNFWIFKAHSAAMVQLGFKHKKTRSFSLLKQFSLASKLLIEIFIEKIKSEA